MAIKRFNTTEAIAALNTLTENGYSYTSGNPYQTKSGKYQMNIWITDKGGAAIHHKDKFLVELGAVYCPKKNAETKGGRAKQHRKEWFIKVVDTAENMFPKGEHEAA